MLEAGGPDGLEWVSRPSWGDFVRPKIAFRGGWAGPGTSLQDADKFRLVSSFREVLSSAENLNLQMFHREGDGSPPALAAHLQWPAPELLHGGAGGAEGTLDVPCDVATRVSRAGAVTWWHLDDGGEHVLQVARGGMALVCPPVVRATHTTCRASRAAPTVAMAAPRRPRLTW